MASPSPSSSPPSSCSPAWAAPHATSSRSPCTATPPTARCRPSPSPTSRTPSRASAAAVRSAAATRFARVSRDESMARYWDARAREDAWYFVDNRLAYRNPDRARFWAGGEADLDALLDAAGVAVAADDVVVDLGCGLGRLTRPLAARVAAVAALDASAEMLARARELNAHLANVTWLHGNGEDLRPLEDGSADGVVSHVVFQHIPD